MQNTFLAVFAALCMWSLVRLVLTWQLSSWAARVLMRRVMPEVMKSIARSTVARAGELACPMCKKTDNGRCPECGLCDSCHRMENP